MADALASYSPVILVDAYFTSTHRFATRDFYDGSDNYYKGTLIESSGGEKELSDLYYGVQPGGSLTLQFSNRDNTIDDTWDEIIAGEEIRGAAVKVQRYDPIDGVVFEFRGKITEYVLGDIVSITIEMRDDEILDILLPKGIVTTDEFTTTALNLGQPINICFGYCRNVPLPNIQNNTGSNYYDYLIGYGTLEGLWVDHPNGKGVKRDGVLVDTSEYTFYDGSQGSPFSGYAFIRFTTEQRNFSGGFHNLTADVAGLEMGGGSANRNFAITIKNLLNNSTWGLNDSVDSTSFSSAATALNNIGNMYCDGAITMQRQARDILHDLLFPARANIERAGDGEWEITIDQAGSSVADFGDNDGFYNNCEILEVTSTPATSALNKAIVHYEIDSYNDETPYKEMEVTVHSGFGVVKTYDLPFVIENLTAERVLSYLKNRSIHSDKRVKLRAGMEGRDRSFGDIITVTAPRRGISAKEYKIDHISKQFIPKPRFIFGCREYSASIHSNETLTKPTDPISSDITVTGPDNLDHILDGPTYAKVLAASLSEGAILLTEAIGDLDDIADGTTYGRILASALSSGLVLLSAASGNLDDITNGSTHGKVLLADISGGHIILANCSGDLDDIDDGTNYGKVLATDISAGHILLVQCTGDLDDIANGTNYGKVLLTDISAGHILLAQCTGDLDDITNGTIYGKILLTDISAGHILLSACVGDLTDIDGDLDDIANGSTYGKILLTDISAGHIKLSEAVGNLDDIDNGTTYEKVLATDISAGHILLAQCTGDLDDITDGGTYGKVLVTDISAGHILLSACTGDLDDILDGTNYGRVASTSISAGKIIVTGLDSNVTDRMFDAAMAGDMVQNIFSQDTVSSLLNNGGFEQVDGSGDAYWWKTATGVSTETSGGDNSDNYLKLTLNGSHRWSCQIGPAGNDDYRYFEVNGGDAYKFGGSCKSDGTATYSLTLRELDKDLNIVHNHYLSGTETSWTKESRQVTLQSNTKFLMFIPQCSGSTGVWVAFDNVYLHQVDALAWSWAHLSDATLIDGGDIYTGTVTAGKISVTDLAAINANCGAITAGTLSSSDWAAAAGIRLDLDNKWLKMGGSNVDAAGSAVGVFLGLDSSYKIYVGDGGNKFIQFDGTDLILGKDTSLRGADSYGMAAIYYHTLCDSLDCWGIWQTNSAYVTLENRYVAMVTGNLTDEYIYMYRGVDYSLGTYTWANDRYWKCKVYFRYNTSQKLWCGMGWVDDSASNQAGFYIDGGNIYGRSGNSTFYENTSSLQSITAETSYILEVEFLAGDRVKFYIDGIYKGQATTYVPSGTTYAEKISYFKLNPESDNQREIRFQEIQFLQL